LKNVQMSVGTDLEELAGMKTESKTSVGATLLALGAIAVLGRHAGAQTAGNGLGALLSDAQASALPFVPAQVVREIDDPHSGARWLLLRDADHPGGPGHLIQVSLVKSEFSHGKLTSPVPAPGPATTRPLIRAGDSLIVEENTALAEARLEAVALGPAVLGSRFDVRLKIGGKVVRAVALAPGRAVLQQRTGARP
jgi:hypothetical protein